MKREYWVKICDALGISRDAGVMDAINEIERLKQINADLLKACKWLKENIGLYTVGDIELTQLLSPIEQAISKAERREGE